MAICAQGCRISGTWWSRLLGLANAGRRAEPGDQATVDEGGFRLADLLGAELLVEGGGVWIRVPLQPRVPAGCGLGQRPLEQRPADALALHIRLDKEILQVDGVRAVDRHEVGKADGAPLELGDHEGVPRDG